MYSRIKFTDAVYTILAQLLKWIGVTALTPVFSTLYSIVDVI